MNNIVFIMEVSYNKGSSNLNLFSNKRTYIIVVVGETNEKNRRKKSEKENRRVKK